MYSAHIRHAREWAQMRRGDTCPERRALPPRQRSQSEWESARAWFHAAELERATVERNRAKRYSSNCAPNALAEAKNALASRHWRADYFRAQTRTPRTTPQASHRSERARRATRHARESRRSVRSGRRSGRQKKSSYTPRPGSARRIVGASRTYASLPAFSLFLKIHCCEPIGESARSRALIQGDASAVKRGNYLARKSVGQAESRALDLPRAYYLPRGTNGW
jgi:hypothetical protein